MFGHMDLSDPVDQAVLTINALLLLAGLVCIMLMVAWHWSEKKLQAQYKEIDERVRKRLAGSAH